MKIRFLADVNLNEAIVNGVRRAQPSVDFLTSAHADLAGLDDDIVLAIAAREERILVTHDLKTMPWHFGRFVAQSNSPGVILISQKTPIAEAIDSLLLVCIASEPADWINRICRLPF